MKYTDGIKLSKMHSYLMLEKGLITLIGATTENPSFTVNAPLLSRTKVFVFKQQSEEDILNLLKKIAKKEFPNLTVGKKELEAMANLSNGDIRSGLNILEMASTIAFSQKKKRKRKPKLQCRY